MEFVAIFEVNCNDTLSMVYILEIEVDEFIHSHGVPKMSSLTLPFNMR